MRWKLLDQEEREILAALEENKGNKDLECALEAVRMRMRLLPSKRGEGQLMWGKGLGMTCRVTRSLERHGMEDGDRDCCSKFRLLLVQMIPM
jgi:hypothetical protein